jgi:hypothetical protein
MTASDGFSGFTDPMMAYPNFADYLKGLEKILSGPSSLSTAERKMFMRGPADVLEQPKTRGLP